jgi:hypothetical protein
MGSRTLIALMKALSLSEFGSYRLNIRLFVVELSSEHLF